ncbi:MAG: hypothetical protein JW741_27275 [Sedimentisphaerales bacterium]|nr:hypothetical protein [Sedimentisphaerales bacterium]
MAKKKVSLEKTYYPFVARWLKRHFLCFRVAINKGLRYGRIDVIGIRDVGGDLSGEVETIAVEVKRGSTPFANACGQTYGYSVYANRVYLADLRGERFSQDETFIASNLGIGLIQIKGERCAEVLSSPFHQPISKMQMRLFEALRLGKCQLCDSIFEIGTAEGNHWSRLARENVAKAIEQEKGLMFWNYEVGGRKRRLGIRGSKGDATTFERRFLCPDCIQAVFAQMHEAAE